MSQNRKARGTDPLLKKCGRVNICKYKYIEVYCLLLNDPKCNGFGSSHGCWHQLSRRSSNSQMARKWRVKEVPEAIRSLHGYVPSILGQTSRTHPLLKSMHHECLYLFTNATKFGRISGVPDREMAFGKGHEEDIQFFSELHHFTSSFYLSIS